MALDRLVRVRPFGVAVVHAALFLAVVLHLFRLRRRTDSTLLWLVLT